MKLKIERNIEYDLKMHVKLSKANILDLRIRNISIRLFI